MQKISFFETDAQFAVHSGAKINRRSPYLMTNENDKRVHTATDSNTQSRNALNAVQAVYRYAIRQGKNQLLSTNCCEDLKIALIIRRLKSL